MLKSFFRKRPNRGPRESLDQAMSLYRQGRLDEAEALFAAMRAAGPSHAGALSMLGLIQLRRGRAEDALHLVDEALRSDPQSVCAMESRGLVLQAQSRLSDALAAFERALILDPAHASAHANRGNVLLALGRTADAIASYEKSLALDAKQPAVQIILAQVLHACGHLVEALAAFDAVVAVDEENERAHYGRGHVLVSLGRPAEAIAAFDRALEIDPFFVDALILRGNSQHALSHDDDALMDFDTALQLAPDSADAWYNQGVVQGSRLRYADAVSSYDRALALKPDYVAAHFNRGIAAERLKRCEDARRSFDAVLAFDPEYPYALGHAAYIRADLCDWRDLSDLTDRAVQGVHRGRVVTDPFTLLALVDDPAVHLASAAIHVARQCPPVHSLRGKARHAHQKIRLAYLSANFRAHAVAYLIAELFERHDRSRFELTAISFGDDDGSPMLARIKASFDRFVDVRGMTDAAAAQQLCAAEIDIAVDLMGHTGDARVGILSHRPAPVQVNFLGYPGTTGATFIDYIIADRFVIPAAEIEHYSEKVVYLPDTFQPNDRNRRIDERTPTRAELGLPEKGFVFCCFNNSYKITAAMFDIWMHLLSAVPDGVLWLLGGPALSENVAREARRCGIDAARLVFARRAPHAEYLARYRLADLFLDTHPFNGGTTSSDALWAGLPVLTCAGKAMAARMAGSLLYALGLPELVTSSLPEYEALALRIARERGYLANLKQKLASRRDTMPLFDSDRYRRHIEAAYQTMVERQRRGEAPASFAVDPAER